MANLTLVAEGATDEAVFRRLCVSTGHSVGPVHITGGKGKLDKRLSGYNNAARFHPWVVLRDLDDDALCAPDLIANLLPAPSGHMFFRVPVHSVESWIIADRTAVAKYLGIGLGAIPVEPEALLRPKRTLVDLARSSPRRDIRRDFVPAPGTSREVGPGYTARVIDFAFNHWDPIRAADFADSLARCVRALQRLP